MNLSILHAFSICFHIFPYLFAIFRDFFLWNSSALSASKLSHKLLGVASDSFDGFSIARSVLQFMDYVCIVALCAVCGTFRCLLCGAPPPLPQRILRCLHARETCPFPLFAAEMASDGWTATTHTHSRTRQRH